MRNISFLFLTILLFACGQQSHKDKGHKESKWYIQILASQDTHCLKDVERAKTDLKNGKIVLCMPMGLSINPLRYEKQLRQLCRKNNIFFNYEEYDDVINVHETQGCYTAYMDKIIAEKFGEDFKEKLLSQADSILLFSNDTIPDYQCDQKPQILSNQEELTLNIKLNSKLCKQIKSAKDGWELHHMVICFYIDRKGIPSGYHLGWFSHTLNKSNDKLKDMLYKMGVNALKKYKHWQPGRIKGLNVITDNSVTVNFIKENTTMTSEYNSKNW